MTKFNITFCNKTNIKIIFKRLISKINAIRHKQYHLITLWFSQLNPDALPSVRYKRKVNEVDDRLIEDLDKFSLFNIDWKEKT